MKEKLKVYHGLPKMPVHEKTVLYASFNGKITPEISGTVTVSPSNTFTFTPSVCGYGLRSQAHNQSIPLKIAFKSPMKDNVYTLDFWVDTSFIKESDMTDVSNGKEQYGAYLNTNVTSTGDIRFFAFHKHNNGTYSNLIRFYTTEGNRDLYAPIRLGINHYRIIRDGNTFSIYVNGSLFHKDTYNIISDGSISNLTYLSMRDLTACVSEVRLVNVNLGDSFPTLPQDFIDGKAIVVPALNQRQSYGDPVLHQVTELLVPATTDSQNYYSHHTTDDSSLWQHDTHPELSVAHADSWVNGAIIRITGLDQTPITGVFDTDTAKCRIVKEVRNTKIVPVNSVSGISVGDALVYVYSSDFRAFNLTYTVQAVDSVNNTITLDSNSNWYAGDYFFETTASSSSPVVKTVEGATVNGTWSGLGTNVATFTLGSNTNIAGKDLVVTYCLNAKGNSSPYPKMPSEVIRGYDELGNELEPVSLVEINDDFKGKLVGDTSNCYHTVKSYAATSFLAPTSSVGSEINQDRYNKLNHPDDYIEVSSTSSAKVQVRFDLDLFKMLEKKLGEEVSLSWVQENVAHIKMNATCKGASYRGNYVEARYYDPKYSDWKLNSSGHSNSTPSFATISATFSGDLIQNKNNCFFMITCSSSDGTTPSYVQIKEVSFNVKLKTGDVYDVLYTKDTSARVSPCNPILIDKQTKEVKRLLPSTAPFSTEVLVHNPTTMSTPITTLIKGTDNVMTTLGSGSSCNKYDVMRGLIGKLGMESHLYTNDTLNKLTYYSVSDHDQRTKIVPRQYYFHNYAKNEIADEDVPKDMSLLALAYDLVVTDSKEVAMKTLCHVIENGKRTEYITHTYVLPNRPLIK